ncbi:MAG: hypothetical protein MHM6MM_002223 [Cercozoa sp. M6MM]
MPEKTSKKATFLSKRICTDTSEAMTSAIHTLEVVNSVLDFQRMQEGNLPNFTDQFSIVDVAAEAVNMQRRLAKPGVELRYDTSGDENIVCSRRAVKLILINMLSNAIKFTQHGYVHLSISVSNTSVLLSPADRSAISAPGTLAFLQIVVSDSGCGVSDEDQVNLFHKFVQVGGDSEAHLLGSGLGLVLVQRIVSSFQGSVRLFSPLFGPSARLPPVGVLPPEMSELGAKDETARGTAFFIEIPVSRECRCLQLDDSLVTSSTAAAQPMSPMSQCRVRCVVVDDEGPNRRVLTRKMHMVSKQLKLQSFETVAFASGEDALARCKEDMFGEQLWLLLDFNLSRSGGVLNGIQLMKQLRTLVNCPSLYLICTGNCTQEDIDRYHSVGFDDVLGKPVPPLPQLTTLMQEHVKRLQEVSRRRQTRLPMRVSDLRQALSQSIASLRSPSSGSTH